MFFHMVYKSGQIFLPFCHNPRVWRTDRRTDGQTDGQRDRILIARPRLHFMQRGKNKIYNSNYLFYRWIL